MLDNTKKFSNSNTFNKFINFNFIIKLDLHLISKNTERSVYENDLSNIQKESFQVNRHE